MSIISRKSYLIHAHFYEGGPDQGPSQYVGDFETLRSTIATTWSKIPHRVGVNANQVEVRHDVSNNVLATFTFMQLTEQKLPEHF